MIVVLALLIGHLSNGKTFGIIATTGSSRLRAGLLLIFRYTMSQTSRVEKTYDYVICGYSSLVK